jgi:hypothetical protein
LNKLFRISGFGLLFICIGACVLGLYSASVVQLVHTDHLRAPASLIWQYISEEDNLNEWMNLVPINSCENDSSGKIICFGDQKKSKIISTIVKDEKNRSLTLILDESLYNPEIGDYVFNLNLKTLRDGTTEINYKLNYKLNSLVAKVVNKLYFEGNQRNLLEKNFEYLHKYFEQV